MSKEYYERKRKEIMLKREPFKEGETVFVHRYGKLQRGVIRFFWGNGDAQIKLDDLRKETSQPPDKIYHQWDIGYAELTNNANREE